VVWVVAKEGDHGQSCRAGTQTAALVSEERARTLGSRWSAVHSQCKEEWSQMSDACDAEGHEQRK